MLSPQWRRPGGVNCRKYLATAVFQTGLGVAWSGATAGRSGRHGQNHSGSPAADFFAHHDADVPVVWVWYRAGMPSADVSERSCEAVSAVAATRKDPEERAMFDSITDLSSKLAATGYFIDPVMTQVVFLAAKLQKPLLLEGPAGTGKTQLALSSPRLRKHMLSDCSATAGSLRTKLSGASTRACSASTWSSRRASTRTGRRCNQI